MKPYCIIDKGERGPHPNIAMLKDWMVLIRAEHMHGPAKQQALEELERRGLWL